MNIVLLNLTRLGDLLQSQAAIADLRAGGHRVALVCLANFSGAARLLDGLEHVAPLPAARLLAALERAKPQEDPVPGWRAALADLAVWREDLFKAFRPDRVCNLTPDVPARMLARFLANGAPCTGFCVDERGFGLNGNAWASFLQGAALERGVSPFNIVDVFRKSALAGDAAVSGFGKAALRAPERDVVEGARERFLRAAPSGHQGFVALQLGASAEQRRWPVESFAALGDRLWEEARLCPVLLGNKAERHLAERYAQLTRAPFLDLCGGTDLEDLAAALCSMRMLITNDTGTMHMAAGLGLPVLALFLATAQPFDTGPYAEGNCSVEPDMGCHPCAFGARCPHDYACRHALSPELIGNLALSKLSEGEWRVSGGPGRVWLSVPGEGGLMHLRSLSGHGGDVRTLWLSVQRHFLRQFLDRPPGSEFAPAPLPHAVSLPEPDGVELAAACGTAAAFADLLRQQGRVLLQRPLPVMRDRFLGTWERLFAALRQNPRLAALAMLWVQETQQREQDLTAVLETAAAFASLLHVLADALKPAGEEING